MNTALMITEAELAEMERGASAGDVARLIAFVREAQKTSEDGPDVIGAAAVIASELATFSDANDGEYVLAMEADGSCTLIGRDNADLPYDAAEAYDTFAQMWAHMTGDGSEEEEETDAGSAEE
jgi:hypothetical protein